MDSSAPDVYMCSRYVGMKDYLSSRRTYCHDERLSDTLGCVEQG